MKGAVMKKEYEIKTAKAKLRKLKSLERNIKNNREEIQSETSKSHQRYSSPGCNNSRNAFTKKSNRHCIMYSLDWGLFKMRPTPTLHPVCHAKVHEH